MKIISIGDLHGNFKALIGNLQYAGMIDSQMNWIGKNTKIIFHGDILADRTNEGCKIYQQIGGYKKIAEINNCQIIMIAGNHEKSFINMLLGKFDFSKGMIFQGHFELLELIGITNHGFDEKLLIQHQNEFLSTVKNTYKGKELLLMINELKIAHRIDNKLFIHTSPNPIFLESIINLGIDEINLKFNKYINLLINGFSENFDEYLNFIQPFLDGQSRWNKVIPYEKGGIYDNIYKLGIDTIINGHNGKGGYSETRGPIKILENDYFYGRDGKYDKESVIIFD